jgi:hypothetical protein
MAPLQRWAKTLTGNKIADHGAISFRHHYEHQVPIQSLWRPL